MGYVAVFIIGLAIGLAAPYTAQILAWFKKLGSKP